jgi:hypothetical protein
MAVAVVRRGPDRGTTLALLTLAAVLLVAALLVAFTWPVWLDRA